MGGERSPSRPRRFIPGEPASSPCFTGVGSRVERYGEEKPLTLAKNRTPAIHPFPIPSELPRFSLTVIMGVRLIFEQIPYITQHRYCNLDIPAPALRGVTVPSPNNDTYPDELYTPVHRTINHQCSEDQIHHCLTFN
jgi:hypothetical protein